MGPHNSDFKEYLFVEICLPTSAYLLNHKRNIESWHLVRDIFDQVIFYYPPPKVLINKELGTDLSKSWEQIFQSNIRFPRRHWIFPRKYFRIQVISTTNTELHSFACPYGLCGWRECNHNVRHPHFNQGSTYSYISQCKGESFLFIVVAVLK